MQLFSLFFFWCSHDTKTVVVKHVVSSLCLLEFRVSVFERSGAIFSCRGAIRSRILCECILVCRGLDWCLTGSNVHLHPMLCIRHWELSWTVAAKLECMAKATSHPGSPQSAVMLACSKLKKRRCESCHSAVVTQVEAPIFVSTLKLIGVDVVAVSTVCLNTRLTYFKLSVLLCV